MKSRAHALLLSLALCVCLLAAGAPAAGASSGGPEYPFLGEVTPATGDYVEISTPEQLAAINDGGLDGNYVLTADIDLSGYGSWTPIGQFSYAPFTGTFDGQGHVIRNLTVDCTSAASMKEAVGLFGYVKDGVIKNLGLESASVSLMGQGELSPAVGGLAGQIENTAFWDGPCGIYNCYVTGAVAMNYQDIEGLPTDAVGGLVGRMVGSEHPMHPADEIPTAVQSSYNMATVTAIYEEDGNMNQHAGGLVGLVEGSNRGFVNCFNLGDVSSTMASLIGRSAAGGIVGYGMESTLQIQGCYNAGDVRMQNKDIFSNASGGPVTYAGGLVGCGECTDVRITDSYNAGAVVSINEPGRNSYAGGILGYSDYLTFLERCYQSGAVEAAGVRETSKSYASGFIGGGPGGNETYWWPDGEYDTQVIGCFLLTGDLSASDGRWAVYGGTSQDVRIENVQALDSLPAGAINDATGLITAAQAARQETYEQAGWDFASAWKMEPGRDYPALAWEVELPAPPAQLTGEVAVVNRDAAHQGIPAQPGHTLAADVSGLTTDRGPEALGALSYQWYCGFDPVDGADGPTFTLPGSYDGSAVRVRVSAAGCVGWVKSAPTPVVQEGTLLYGAVAINNTQPEMGDVLEVDLSQLWCSDPDATYTYQWLRNGGTILGATQPTYQVWPSDVGYTISVRVGVARTEEYLTSEKTAEVTEGAFAGGSGTAEDPYVIAEPAQWTLMAYYINGAFPGYREASYLLAADLDMGGKFVDGIQGFAGALDGGGHKLANFKNNDGGVFASINGGTVKNLRVEDAAVEGEAPGGLAGTMTGGLLDNCSFSGTVCGEYSAAGLVNLATQSAVLRNCRSYGELSSTKENGEFAGAVLRAVDCTMEGLVNFSNLSDLNAEYCCGLVKEMTRGTLTDCANYGRMYNYYAVAGLVGVLQDGAAIDRCVNYGSVSTAQGMYWAGGLVGWLKGGSITNSVNHGSVSSTEPLFGIYGGGIAARIGGSDWNEVVIRNCGNTGNMVIDELAGNGYMGGLAGYINSCQLTVEHFFTSTYPSASISDASSSYDNSLKHFGHLFGGIASGVAPKLQIEQATCYAATPVVAGIIRDDYPQSQYYTEYTYMNHPEFSGLFNSSLDEGLLQWKQSETYHDGYPYLPFQEPRVLAVTPDGVETRWMGRSLTYQTRVAAALYSPEGQMLAFCMQAAGDTGHLGVFRFDEPVEVEPGCTVKLFWLDYADEEPLGLGPVWPVVTYQVP